MNLSSARHGDLYRKEQTSISSRLEHTAISVLIAAYNSGAFLRRAVRSALAQTLAPREILIIDDGSTDNTLAIATTLASEDSRVRVLTLPVNSGPAAARNVGLNAAQGDWVAVLDADDAFIPSGLELLAAAQVGKNVDIVLDNFLFFDSLRGVPTSPALTPSELVERIDVYDFVQHARPYADQTDWGRLKPMFRREFLNKHGLRYPEFCRHGEDFLLMFQALYAGGSCLLVHTPGYLYTTRDSGMSRTNVDYRLMAKQTADIMNRPGVRADIRLFRLLRQRVADLKRWSTELQLLSAKKKRAYIQLIFLTVTNTAVALRAARWLSKQMRF